MGHRFAPLLAVILSILAGGAFFSLVSEILLTIENLNCATGPSVQTKAPQRFEMGYVHSMYDRPVEETFRIEGDRIILEDVKTDHPGITQYYGAEEAGNLSRLNRDLGPSFIIQIGLRGGQTLRIDGKVLLLEEMGRPGDRIRVAVKRVARWKRIMAGNSQSWPEEGKSTRQKSSR